MARITLADWTCSINNCRNPLDGDGLHHKFSRYWSKLPGAWIVGQEGMIRTLVSLRATDYSFITKGEISISHIHNLMPGSSESAYDRIWKSLRVRGVHWIEQVGYWTSDLTLHIHDAPPFPTLRKIGEMVVRTDISSIISIYEITLSILCSSATICTIGTTANS